MEVKSYLFQSPYPSQVQFGRENTVSKENEKMQQDSAQLEQQTNQTARDAKTMETSQSREVEPRVTQSSDNSRLDVYA